MNFPFVIIARSQKRVYLCWNGEKAENKRNHVKWWFCGVPPPLPPHTPRQPPPWAGNTLTTLGCHLASLVGHVSFICIMVVLESMLKVKRIQKALNTHGERNWPHFLIVCHQIEIVWQTIDLLLLNPSLSFMHWEWLFIQFHCIVFLC